MNYILLLCK